MLESINNYETFSTRDEKYLNKNELMINRSENSEF